jgi:sensor histidine kinase regulating citrate/malate metabolism
VVRLQVSADERNCEFSVWNAGGIPKPIALQIFRRSFSTKATKGRGLGTFSMKLFGERYLGGTVRFKLRKPKGPYSL